MSRNTSLNQLDPSEILEPLSIQHYQDGLNLIWQELVRLNSSLFILRKLFDFPSDWILGPEKGTFLTLVKVSLFEHSLLTVSKLTTDTGKDLLLIRRFKNWVSKHIKEEYKKSFYRSLKENDFDKIIKTLPNKEKVKDIRDNFIAHIIVDENLRPKITEDIEISLGEVNTICKQLNNLFAVLCFGGERLMVPIDYSPIVQHPVGSDPRSDIEYFLDLIVQDSALFKMPEESPYWDIEKEHLNPEAINIINEYRKKFGLPEA